MMEAIAKHRYARTSAQKARLVADQVRGLSVDKALNILTFSPKKAAVLVKKVLDLPLQTLSTTKAPISTRCVLLLSWSTKVPP